MKPEDFPILLSTVAGIVSREIPFRDAIAAISSAIAIGSMRKVAHKCVTAFLNRVVWDAGNKVYRRAIFAASQDPQNPTLKAEADAAYALASSIPHASLREILSAKKRSTPPLQPGPSSTTSAP